MTRKEQIKILNNKIKANNAQFKIDRSNGEISAFSGGDLEKYEYLTHKDLKIKPNAVQKAKFDFFPLSSAFNLGLNKKAEDYQEEGVIKLLKDIRDKVGGISNNKKMVKIMMIMTKIVEMMIIIETVEVIMTKMVEIMMIMMKMVEIMMIMTKMVEMMIKTKMVRIMEIVKMMSIEMKIY